MSKGDYSLDLVSVFPDTQLLIFRFLEGDPDRMGEFAKAMRHVFADNPSMRVLVTGLDFEVDVLDDDELAEMGLYKKKGMLSEEEGELAALSLAVDIDPVTVFNLAQALKDADLEEVQRIKERLIRKATKGKCPICGSYCS